MLAQAGVGRALGDPLHVRRQRDQGPQRGAPHPELALEFIDYVLRPEVSVLISREFPYTNPNLAARKLLTPEELANPASYPKGDAKLETFRDVGEGARRIEQLVREVRASTY